MSPMSLYKPGQGKWARGAGAGALVALGIWGAAQTYNWWGGQIALGTYISCGIVLVGFLTGAFLLANRPRSVDLLIDTEVEMKKVTWPTGREVLGATAVVIVVVILLGIYLAATDQLLGWVFRLIHVM